MKPCWCQTLSMLTHTLQTFCHHLTRCHAVTFLLISPLAWFLSMTGVFHPLQPMTSFAKNSLCLKRSLQKSKPWPIFYRNCWGQITLSLIITGQLTWCARSDVNPIVDTRLSSLPHLAMTGKDCFMWTYFELKLAFVCFSSSSVDKTTLHKLIWVTSSEVVWKNKTAEAGLVQFCSISV